MGGCLGNTDATGTATGTAWPAIAGQSCPPHATSYDRAVCSHTADLDTAPVSLASDPRTSSLDDGAPVDEVTLTLSNRSATDLRFNPHSWRIRHLTGGDWSEMERRVSGNGVVTVPANDAHTWSFTEAVNSLQEEPELNPGLYAAEIGVPDPEADDDWIGCIALVRFDPSE